jgi:hypothetical protein
VSDTVGSLESPWGKNRWISVGRLIIGLFNKNYSRILLQFGRLGIWEIPFIFKPKKQAKGIVSLLQILSYFSHCLKEWRNFTFARVKNSFRMKIRIMVGDDITHTHGFFPIDFRILGKKRLPGRVPGHAYTASSSILFLRKRFILSL